MYKTVRSHPTLWYIKLHKNIRLRLVLRFYFYRTTDAFSKICNLNSNFQGTSKLQAFITLLFFFADSSHVILKL